MSKIRDTDYLTISARVRAMENRLVTRERMERMVEARSDDEAVKVLAECGSSFLSRDSIDDARRNLRSAGASSFHAKRSRSFLQTFSI